MYETVAPKLFFFISEEKTLIFYVHDWASGPKESSQRVIPREYVHIYTVAFVEYVTNDAVPRRNRRVYTSIH